MGKTRVVVKGDKALVKFRHDGFDFTVTVRGGPSTSARQEAQAGQARLERRLALLRSGDLAVPAHVRDKKTLRNYLWGGDSAIAQTVEKENGNGHTLQELADKWLEMRERQVKAREKGARGKGSISQASFSSDVYRIQTFLDYAKTKQTSRLKTVISHDFLFKYREAILKSGESGASKKHKLRTVKACLKYAAKLQWVDAVPLIVSEDDWAEVALAQPKPQTFTVEQVGTLLHCPNERLRLYILLGLNCGYTQSDIASLTPDMVDWEAGTISRDRQKTGVESSHKLWPETMALLDKLGNKSDNDSPLLLNANRKPLYAEYTKANGKRGKVDSIGQAFKTWASGLGFTLTFKHLRKTGATALAKQFQTTPWVAKLFLSHHIAGVQKHYTPQFFDLLYEATAWLREHFQVDKGC